MTGKMLIALFCLLLGNIVSCLDGPVFINQDIAVQVATPVAKNENLQTQTVYGFLDFTTTIGNTVMIFSPQSAAAAITEKSKDVSSNTIIETSPPDLKKEVVNIKPSKPQAETRKTEVAQKITSVIQVNPDPPPKAPPSKVSSKIEVKSSPATKVNVIEGKSTQKYKPPPIIVSKVEVIEETKPTVIQSIISKVEVVTEATAKPVIASKVEIISEEKPTETVIHSVVQVKSDDEPAAIVGNNIGEPEYEFLHRQPSEVVEETYKVINLRPSSKFQLKPRQTAEGKNRATKKAEKDTNPHPTGLVSKMEGMVVNDGIMTSYETSVIGTYINGKYAQVLQSTSHVFNQPKDSNNQPKGKIAPTQTLRILKTAAPSLKVNKNRQHLDPTPTININEDVSVAAADAFNAQNSIKTTRKPAKRFKNRQKEVEPIEHKSEKEGVTSQATFKKSSKNRTSSSRNSKPHASSQRRSKSGRGSRKSKSSKTTTPHPSTYSDEPTPAAPTLKRFNSGRKKQNARASIVSNEEKNNAGFSRRGYKPRVQASTVDQNSASTSLYKFKLNRSPGRWQYKTTSKPRVTIRKQNEDEDNITNNNEALETTSSSKPDVAQQNKDVVTPQARSDDVDSLEGSESIATIIDDESATENKVDVQSLPLETLKVEISTPPDFKDVYYEIATIKSPYTFQVGSVKNTRYITVTSTFEKHLENIEPTNTLAATEPLTENILATTSNYAKDNNLDSSIVTLPPIYLASDVATPPLETLTETFSTTQTVLKTHILPVIRSVNDTTSSTLVQTYVITRLVTATKTLPPMEAYHFNPSKTLNEFNSRLDEAGSELHLELEFGDSNEQDEDGLSRKVLPADLDLANIGTDFKLPETDKAKIEQELKNRKVQQQTPQSSNDIQQNLSPDQLQQLALLRLLNPGAPQGQVITTSRPVFKLETIYETHVLPVTQGHNTILSTISKVKGTLTKTDYEFGTSTIAPSFPQAVPQIPQIQQIPQIPQIPQINPLFPQAQPQFTITTSAVTHNTVVTQTNSKILKLTFGARTALTTVFSTTVIPTVVTSYMTASVPFVAQTAAFPGYFPAPYPAYPYVG